LHRQLCALAGNAPDGVAIGATLEVAPEQPVGEITSALRDPESGCWLALGYVKRAHAAPGSSLRAGSSQWAVVGHVPAENPAA
jgi:glycine cleavage system aminomethyltransferase T